MRVEIQVEVEVEVAVEVEVEVGRPQISKPELRGGGISC